jgi:preprotein translocase subunit SecF
MRLIKDTNIDFIGRRRTGFVVSLVLIVVGLVSMAVRGGIRLGVEFTGGVQVEVGVEGGRVDIARVRTAVAAAGYDNRSIQRVGGREQNIFLVQVQAASPEAAPRAAADTSATLATTTSDRILEALRAELAPQTVALRAVESIGPKVGGELKLAAVQAVLLSTLLILVYLAWRFEFRFGVATVVAMLHDTLVTLGLFSLFNKEMTLSVVAAFLTLVGYSVNDTIVIFDRIREELLLKQRRESLESIYNAGINKTLGRTLLTSVTTLFVLMALLLYGGEVIHDFAWVLLIGIVVGTYSSVFVAAPFVIEWYNRRALREAQKAA